jgi:hypothetical protein
VDHGIGQEYANITINMDVDTLYKHLFNQDSDTMNTVFNHMNFTEVEYTPLQKATDGSTTQILSYIVPLYNSIGPKQCKSSTKQIMMKDNICGNNYVIETETTATGIPYSDSFHIQTRYCVTKVSENSCRLRITSDIVFTKRVLELTKDIIVKESDEGMRKNTRILLKTLNISCITTTDPVLIQNPSQDENHQDSTDSTDVVYDTDSSSEAKTTSASSLLEEPSTPHMDTPTQKSNDEYKMNPLLELLCYIMIFLMVCSCVYIHCSVNKLHKELLRRQPVHGEWFEMIQQHTNKHRTDIVHIKEAIQNVSEQLEEAMTSLIMLQKSLSERKSPSELSMFIYER